MFYLYLLVAVLTLAKLIQYDQEDKEEGGEDIGDGPFHLLFLASVWPVFWAIIFIGLAKDDEDDF